MVSNAQKHLAMTGESFRMTRSTLALIAVLLAGSASAQVVIDASDYPIGTDISNAIPGVSLSFITLSSPGERPSLGTSLSSVLYTASPLSVELGTMQNGDTYSVLGGYTGGDTFQNLILVQFAQPISAFSFVSLNDAGDPSVADLFNSSGIDIANPVFGGPCAVSNATGFCDYFNTGGSYQSSTPISTMMIGSTSAGGYVLSVNAPEIDSSSAVTALTLLLGSLMVLRSRRPKSVMDGAVSG
jgi:hypothetical protein